MSSDAEKGRQGSVVLILLIFFMPEGIMGLDLRSRLRARERRASRATEG